MDALFAFVLLGAMVFGFALVFKNRVAVAKWLNSPSLAVSEDIKTRKRYLQRKIEDAEAELEKIEEIESSKK